MRILCAKNLQEKVENAGIKILEVRITHLAYAPEIASAMLQRQQAAAIIDARQKIVEGAVGMVEMALEKLNENEIVELDEERKAAIGQLIFGGIVRKQRRAAHCKQRGASIKKVRR